MSGVTGCEHPSTSGVVDEEFPALVKAVPSKNNIVAKNSLLPAYHPSKVTKTIEITSDRPRQKDDDIQGAFRVNEAQNAICSKIARETGVEITLNRSRPQALVVIVSGSPRDVEKAENLVLAKLRQQETKKITVPQEYHGFLIGKRGDRLRGIQATTLTRIIIPPSGSPDHNTITIIGPPHGVIEAESQIKKTIERQSQMGFERLDIPKIYHPFICGPSNETVDELRKRTDTQINIPPYAVQANSITISGKRDDVAQAAREILEIYDQVKSYKTISVCVKKSQHHLVSGPRGSGLSEILAATGVSVEIPSDSTSEEIVLRGRPEDMGRALSMVYERAVSSITEVVRAPNRFHKLLIGKRGSAITELREGFDKVNIEFGDNQDSVLVRGPPEEVAAIVRRLEARVAELEAKLAIDTIRVDPKYFRHIIGRQGATVLRLCENNVQINLPTSKRNSNANPDEIVIEGDPSGIAKVKAEIAQLVKKLENEKCKDVIIDPPIQHLLRSGYSGNPALIRQIYDLFPKVTVVWPSSDETSHDPTESLVQLRGDRQQVDAAAEKLSKLIKQAIEENYRQEIRIFDEFRAHIMGKNSSKINKLLEETCTRLQSPSPSEASDLFTIIGREANVLKAVKEIEEMQKKLANIKELTVSVPSALTTRFVGNQAPSLRFILDQCPGVHIRFSNPRQRNLRKTAHDEVVMIGPEDALAKAKKLVDQMNSKVSELCAEELVHVDPKFHGFLIGRQGCNLTRFREKHNVELVFPDRFEHDARLASEIRIVGSKEAVVQAKRDLEGLIKSIEDEVEQTVQVDPELIREIANYRRMFPQPELNEVRIIMPKTLNPSTDVSEIGNGDSSTRTVGIRLVGQKASVEAAVETLQSLVSDIESKVSREYPITDQMQFMTLDRMRSQFRALERECRVFIALRRFHPPEEPAGNPAVEESQNTPQPCGFLLITGRPERIDLVYNEKLVPLLPVEEEFTVPKQFHRLLISVPPRPGRDRPVPKGKQAGLTDGGGHEGGLESQSKAAELRQKYGVLVRLPPQHEVDSNFVVLRGTPAQIAQAKTELEDWVRDCEARNFELSLEVPSRFIQNLTALRPKLVAKHNIRMRFGPDLVPQSAASEEESSPPRSTAITSDSAADDEGIDVGPADDSTEHSNGSIEERVALITLHGYADRVKAAKSELESTIAQLQRQTTEELYIPSEVHSILIGSRGSAIQRVMHDYKVRIEFPTRQARESGDANAVLVTGDPDDVDRACDFLISKANDLMDRFTSEVRHSTQRDQYRVDLLPTAAATGQ